MRLGKLNHLVILPSIMLNNSLPDFGNVEEAVKEIRRPIEIVCAGSNSPAETTETVE
jgi:hypothetical protein